MITVEGLYGIKATILADSITKAGKRFTTLEIEYPRIILAELNTHRMLSKNSFSSRAVPFKKMLDNLRGRPVRFGANQAGMQDKGVDYDAYVHVRDSDGYGNFVTYPLTAEEAWDQAKQVAIGQAEAFSEAGYHKQVFNRLLESWQMMKTVISGTEWANFEWLRDHGAADPTFHELARVIREAKALSTPQMLSPGEWHLPYVDWHRSDNGQQIFYITGDTDDGRTTLKYISLDEAIKVSCARCAAVSYRNEGYELEKSLEVYDNLVGADRKHASAFEHQATPAQPYVYEWGGDNATTIRLINAEDKPHSWEPGITHVDRKGQLWSGNLQGWIQYRKLIPGENYEG